MLHQYFLQPGVGSVYRPAMKRFVVFMIGGLLVAGASWAATINKIIATVDGDPITLFQLKQFTERNIRGREMQGADRAAVLDTLITEQIVAKEVAEKGIIVRDEEVQRYIDNIKARNNLDDMQLEQALAAQGLTMAAYRQQIRQDLQRQQLVSREIRGKVSITPEDVRRYYDAHREEFGTGDIGFQVAHIVLRLPPDAPSDRVASTMAKADEVRARVAQGADFAEVARVVSEDVSAKDGGSIGWFKPGELLDEMDKAVAKLKPGEISEPVRTKIGVHVIKLVARRAAGNDGPEGEVAEQIKDKLYAQALEERFQKWISEDLKKQHQIEIR